jgi:hypothetical protein
MVFGQRYRSWLRENVRIYTTVSFNTRMEGNMHISAF